MIVRGFAYIQGLQYFRELFNIHKNDAPHEHQQPEGTEMMNLFDGHIRVVLLIAKTDSDSRSTSRSIVAGKWVSSSK